MKPILLLALVFALPASAIELTQSSAGVTLSSSASGRAAKLVHASLEGTLQPSDSPTLRISDELRFGLTQLPALDYGGAVSGDTRAILGLLLGLIVGFGTGHLVVKDRDGFILFLLIDIAICVAASLISFVWWTRGPGGLFYLALVVSHVIQGLDAYGQASGDRIIQNARENDVGIAVAPGREKPTGVARIFGLAF